VEQQMSVILSLEPSWGFDLVSAGNAFIIVPPWKTSDSVPRADSSSICMS
jgi:hypothetical protein